MVDKPGIENAAEGVKRRDLGGDWKKLFSGSIQDGFNFFNETLET
jgi:hypothetical protein